MATSQEIREMVQQAKEQGRDYVYVSGRNRLKKFMTDLPEPLAWRIFEAIGQNLDLKQFLKLRHESFVYYRNKKERQKRKAEEKYRNQGQQNKRPTITQKLNDMIDFLQIRGECTIYENEYGSLCVLTELMDFPLNLAFEIHHAVEGDRALPIKEFQQVYDSTRITLDLEAERSKTSKVHPLSGLPIKGGIKVFEGGRADGNSSY